MKPRNKFEKAVLDESKNLRPITKTQCKWAFRECIDHFAYRLPKGRITCMDCGHSWTMEKTTDTSERSGGLRRVRRSLRRRRRLYRSRESVNRNRLFGLLGFGDAPEL